MEAARVEYGIYSAKVRMELHLNGSVLQISHLGPDFLILSEPIDQPPGEGEIVTSIDGSASRWIVRLLTGMSRIYRRVCRQSPTVHSSSNATLPGFTSSI
jgi:hypothetical protein